jgi:hypothetical protein
MLKKLVYSLVTLAALVPLVLVLVSGLRFIFRVESTALAASNQATENKEGLRSSNEQIQILTDIHKQQEAVKEAEQRGEAEGERKAIERLCREKTLEGDVCE